VKELITYEEFNPRIANVALQKFSNHMWYLTEVSIGFSVFDTMLSDQERESIVSAMKNRMSKNSSKRRIPVGARSLIDKTLADLATTRTLRSIIF